MSKTKKKKKSGLVVLLAFVIFALMTAACFMPFAEGLNWKGSVGVFSATSSATGFELIFGTKDSEGNLQNTNATLVVAYILLIVAALMGAAATFFGVSKKGDKLSKGLAILGGLIGLSAGIMFLFGKQILDVENASGTLFGITGKSEFHLGIGFILPGVFGCVSGLSSVGVIVASL